MKKALIFVAIALVLVCGIGGYYMKNMAAQMQAAQSKGATGHTVARGDLVVSVVDTGTIDAVNSVEVKSRVSGRLSELFVEEGDFVTQGQIIGTIDPQETQFVVAQNQAQLRGAQSGAARTAIEIQQRRVSAQADYLQAQSRLRRLDMEVKAQPTLTSSAITEATAEHNRSLRERENLVKNEQPTARSRAVTSQRDAQANFDNAKRESERRESLLKQGFVSVRDVEAAKLNMDVARIKLEQATDELSRIDSEFSLQIARSNEAVRASEAGLQRARTNSIQNGVKREEYRQAVSDVAKARASLQDVAALQRSREQNMATVSQLASVLQDSQRQLRETQIKSPITGVVTKKMLKVGELASGLSGFSAGTPIVRIEDRTTLRVLLNVNEIDVAKMSNGMKATVTVDALPNDKFSGFVKRIAPTSITSDAGATAAASDAVVKYEVELELANADKRLRSGMSAKCTLDVIRRTNVLVLPRDYVGKDDKGYFVNKAGDFAPNEPEPTQPKPAIPGAPPSTERPLNKTRIKVGAESGTQYEITEGVKEGDKLVQPQFTGPARKGMMMMGADGG
ncbi:MAG: efflux RND transporter periplasmic adaptor subunit [Chlorobia bacterium]|nr:efflux RND transporter periplasmic adaptor subunit [Fimbriimonadaceae bacterium]